MGLDLVGLSWGPGENKVARRRQCAVFLECKIGEVPKALVGASENAKEWRAAWAAKGPRNVKKSAPDRRNVPRCL